MAGDIHDVPVLSRGRRPPGASWVHRLAMAALTAALTAALATSAAGATTFLVDQTYDAVDALPGDGACADNMGRCTLRAAVMEANAHPGSDEILLTDPYPTNAPMTLTLAGRGEDLAAAGDLDLTDDVTIRTQGFPSSAMLRRIIDAGGRDRIFHVHPGVFARITGVILKNGDVSPTNENGGAILSQGALALRHVVVRDSVAGQNGGGIAAGDILLEDSMVSLNRAGGDGGGVFTGWATIRRSNITSNSASGSGGGLFISPGTSVTVEASAIVDNESTGDPGPQFRIGGGGIYLAATGLATRRIVNSTVARNRSTGPGGGIHSEAVMQLGNTTITDNFSEQNTGGLFARVGLIQMSNTILFGNTPVDCGPVNIHVISTFGYNLAGDSTCDLGPTDLPNTDPMLGVLTLNGGTTASRAPQPGSPVIDAVGGGYSTPDQRGVTRPQFGAPDIGAVEYSAMGNGSQLYPLKIDLGRIRETSSGDSRLEFRGGFPSFVALDLEGEGYTPEMRAFNLLDRHAALYLQHDPDVRLVHSRTDADSTGGGLVRFAQTFRGFPVYGAEIVVREQMGAAGMPPRIRGTSGMLMPTVQTNSQLWQDIAPCFTPALTEAEAVAIASGATGIPSSQVRGRTEFVVYDSRIFGERYVGPAGVHLAYRVSLGTAYPKVVLVDAHDGGVLLKHSLSWSSSHRDYDLDQRDLTGIGQCPGGALIGDEGGLSAAYTGDPDAVTAWNAASATFWWFDALFGRYSHDDDDGEVRASINIQFTSARGSVDTSCGISFGTGQASLDLFAHEYTHLVTHNESRLLSHGESGALNEAFSDIMAFALDTQDAVLFEDRTDGAGPYRDLSNPPAFNCTLSDRMPSVFPCPDHLMEYEVSSADDAAVHTNGNILNKAFYLMAEGGPFTGFGRTKMAQLAYRAFTALSPSDGFFDLRGTAIDWAGRFAATGMHGFTAADVCTVRNAFAEVGIGAPDGDCDGMEDGLADPDADGIMGPAGGGAGPSPCTSGRTQSCDDNCPDTPNSNQANQDGDSMGDVCDPDDDNDGTNETEGPCAPLPSPDTDGDGIADCLDDDRDGDGVAEDGDDSGLSDDNPCPHPTGGPCDDNCPNLYNPGQTDGDGNGVGDTCDPDVDGDGRYPSQDNCPFVSSLNQDDADGDGLGDACDLCPGTPDNWGQYHPGFPDVGTVPYPVQDDSDGDGTPDACDPVQFGDVTVLLDGAPYSFFNASRPDNVLHTMQVQAPPGEARGFSLEIPACRDGLNPLAPDQAVEIRFTDMPAEIGGALEDALGRKVADIRPDLATPNARGLRFRPRCDQRYFLRLATDASFGGDATFTVQSRLIVPGPVNPYMSSPSDPMFPPPAPLPDADMDGLWDGIDKCPNVFSPSNRDGDADGFGDECDICPTVSNPGQMLLDFPEVIALDSMTLSWGVPADYLYVKGPLSMVSTYGISESGPGSGTTFPIGSQVEPPTWYLFRHATCGTWGSAGADMALP